MERDVQCSVGAMVILAYASELHRLRKGERQDKDPIEQIPNGQAEDSFVQVSQSQTQDPVTTIWQTDRHNPFKEQPGGVEGSWRAIGGSWH